MYIGLIGSSLLCRKGRKASLAVPEVTVQSLIYEAVTDAPDLALENQSRMDALLFLGLAPYLFALNSVPRTIPWFCSGIPPEGVMAALLDARQHLNGKLRFSIDSFAEKDIFEILDETSLDVQSVYTLPYRPVPDHEKNLVDFHTRCYEEKKTDFCLTWLYTGYKILRKKGVPAYYISPTVHSIREVLTRAVEQLNAPKGEGLRTVVGLYSVENASELGEKRMGEVRDALFFRALRHNLLPVEKSPSLFQVIGSYEQFLVTTKNFTASPLREALEKACPGLKVRAGYGLAPVLSTAAEWAERALQSLLPGLNYADCLFDGQDYRRMGDAEFSAPLTDGQRRIASRLKLTDATFRRYLQALSALEDPFSAKEFAHVTGIQPPAARKIFVLLEREDVIEAAGKRPALAKGRPEILYRLKSSL